MKTQNINNTTKKLNPETVKQIEALKEKALGGLPNNIKSTAEMLVEIQKIGIENIIAYFGK